jgi:diguanylate cyclase (GGDEF)-like protein/PAS domain S-box-containing protein
VIRQELFLAAIVASSRDAIIGKDLDGGILSWSPGAERLYGYTAEEMKGRSIRVLVPEARQHEISHILDTIARGEPIADHETVRVTKDGRQITVLLSVSPIRDPGGEIIGAATIARYITEERRLQRELERMAHHDDLTGLANRRRFIEELEAYVERASRYGWKGAVVALDVDALKAVNDSMGHRAGDQLLKETAARLGQTLRRSDFLARLSGDEFAAILPEASARDAEAVARKLIAALEVNETRIAGIRAGTASAGVALLEEGITADELMIRADVALYQAKRRGGNRFAFYDSASAHTVPGGTAASARDPS